MVRVIKSFHAYVNNELTARTAIIPYACSAIAVWVCVRVCNQLDNSNSPSI